MKKARRATIAIVLVALCSGACLSSTTLVRVKADGSGTIEQATAFNADVAAQFTQMAAAMA